MTTNEPKPCDDRTCKCSDSYGFCRSDDGCIKDPMEQRSEPEEKYDLCGRCGRPIPKFDGICEECQIDLQHEQEEAYRQYEAEAYREFELEEARRAEMRRDVFGE